MKYISKKFLALFIVGTLFLIPNFYRNWWAAVESGYYNEWQTRNDRMVVARLVKTRQDGFLSAGGFMGLGDTEAWNALSATHRHQYKTYLENDAFRTYLVYKSNPGFQGFVYGTLDQILNIPENQKLKLFRGLTALASAAVFGLMFAALVLEFGYLSGIFMLLFSAFSMWIVLPAGSIFWDFWAFFLSFLASAFLLAQSARENRYDERKIHGIIFITFLMKILFSGFDITTTVMVMTTVPFVYYGIASQWDRKAFLTRFIKIGVVISAATLTGLLILAAQIFANDGSIRSVLQYVENRFASHAAGSSALELGEHFQATDISTLEVIGKYLAMPAITRQFQNTTVQVLYWQIIVLFLLCTVTYLLIYRLKRHSDYPRKAVALIAATWYSILAPLSWFVLFKPHAIIHTHVNTMGWQMPFVLLGFALCGYIIQDLFKAKSS